MPTPILCSPGSPLRQPASSHTHSSYEENLCYRDTRVQNFFGASTRIRASIRVGRDATRTRHAAAVSGQLRSSSARPPSTRRPPGALQLRSPFARCPPSRSRHLPTRRPPTARGCARAGRYGRPPYARLLPGCPPNRAAVAALPAVRGGGDDSREEASGCRDGREEAGGGGDGGRRRAVAMEATKRWIRWMDVEDKVRDGVDKGGMGWWAGPFGPFV